MYGISKERLLQMTTGLFFILQSQSWAFTTIELTRPQIVWQNLSLEKALLNSCQTLHCCALALFSTGTVEWSRVTAQL